MSEELEVQVKDETEESGILKLTQEEVDRRIEDEDGFAVKFLNGEVEVVDNPVVEGDAEKEEIVITDEVPKTETEEKVEDKELSVTIKQSQLGNYKTIGEHFKAAEEGKNHIDFQKNRISDLEKLSMTNAETANTYKAELDKLKEQLKTDTPKKAEEAKVETTLEKPADAVVFDVPADDSLFEEENVKKLYTNFANVSKNNTALNDHISNLTKQITEMKDEISGVKTQSSTWLEEQKRNAETDKQTKADSDLYYGIENDLQAKNDFLKTKRPIREIDKSYNEFYNNLAVAHKAKDATQANAIAHSYFNDSTETGDKVREIAKQNGLVPPEEVETYNKIKAVVNESNKFFSTDDKGNKVPISLVKALSLIQTENKNFNPGITTAEAEKNKNFMEAKQEKASSAEIMNADATQNNISMSDVTEEHISQLLEVPFPLLVKDESKRKVLDTYYVKMGWEPIPWSKYGG